MAFESKNLEPIAQELAQRIEQDAMDAEALMGFSTLLQLAGNPDRALRFQEQALRTRQHFRLLTSDSESPLRVLVILSRGVIMDNMPIEFLLETSEVQLESLYVGEEIPVPSSIPEHDIAIVGVCESDANQNLLRHLNVACSQWPKPILNSAKRIANLARDRIGTSTAGIENLAFAPSRRVSQSELLADGLAALPRPRSLKEGWIIRPVSSHAGQGLERIGCESSLQDYLVSNRVEEYFVAPFVNYQNEDGVYRKYRVALVDGRSYPVHMAISRNWMVHYLNSDMLHNEMHRREEASFLTEYRNHFESRHKAALNTLALRLGLDYVVIDCAETPQGELLLFEADNGAVVHSMDPVDIFPYKKPAMHRIFDAFLNMLHERAKVTALGRAA